MQFRSHLSIEEDQGNTILHQAAMNGDTATASKILHEMDGKLLGPMLVKPDYNHDLPLDRAAARGHNTIVKDLILKHKQLKLYDYSVKNKQSYTPLLASIRSFFDILCPDKKKKFIGKFNRKLSDAIPAYRNIIDLLVLHYPDLVHKPDNKDCNALYYVIHAIADAIENDNEYLLREATYIATILVNAGIALGPINRQKGALSLAKERGVSHIIEGISEKSNSLRENKHEAVRKIHHDQIYASFNQVNPPKQIDVALHSPSNISLEKPSSLEVKPESISTVKKRKVRTNSFASLSHQENNNSEYKVSMPSDNENKLSFFWLKHKTPMTIGSKINKERIGKIIDNWAGSFKLSNKEEIVDLINTMLSKYSDSIIDKTKKKIIETQITDNFDLISKTSSGFLCCGNKQTTILLFDAESFMKNFKSKQLIDNLYMNKFQIK